MDHFDLPDPPAGRDPIHLEMDGNAWTVRIPYAEPIEKGVRLKLLFWLAVQTGIAYALGRLLYFGAPEAWRLGDWSQLLCGLPCLASIGLLFACGWLLTLRELFFGDDGSEEETTLDLSPGRVVIQKGDVPPISFAIDEPGAKVHTGPWPFVMRLTTDAGKHVEFGTSRSYEEREWLLDVISRFLRSGRRTYRTGDPPPGSI